jgi:hypothetical protein
MLDKTTSPYQLLAPTEIGDTCPVPPAFTSRARGYRFELRRTIALICPLSDFKSFFSIRRKYRCSITPKNCIRIEREPRRLLNMRVSSYFYA